MLRKIFFISLPKITSRTMRPDGVLPPCRQRFRSPVVGLQGRRIWDCSRLQALHPREGTPAITSRLWKIKQHAGKTFHLSPNLPVIHLRIRGFGPKEIRRGILLWPQFSRTSHKRRLTLPSRQPNLRTSHASFWNEAPCTKRKERTRGGRESDRQRPVPPWRNR